MMDYTKKKLEDMDVMDDFLMGQLAADESFGTDFCRLVISTLLQRKIGKLRVSTQKVLAALTPSLRGIRMDVEMEELGEVEGSEEPAVMNIYDMEPHLYKGMDIPRHNRFYQAKIDSREENVTDWATTELHSYVSRVKLLPEVRDAYMKWDEYIYYMQKEEREKAAIDTMVQNIQDILEEYGGIPEHVKSRLVETDDKEILKKWLKLSAKVNSIEEFEAGMQPI